ncbi:MAG TPA: L,D-transpeptidase [Fimbriimonadaceae bacterium]|nr:L,D-transpeptidase [Fimbriimonadaceae bacterium]HRJ32138.1 L,D-transpeptidase [Fimbriimonadaceae bacterium]
MGTFWAMIGFAIGMMQSEPAWFLVPPGREASIAAAMQETPPVRPLGQSITVCLKTQMLRAFEGEELIFEFPCSTGKNNGTPAGDFRIREKARYNRALPEYGSVPIPFSLRLDVVVQGRRKRIAIHAHSSVPRRPASHGCIRLSHANAQKLFNWARVGTTVSIVRQAPEGPAISAAANP